MVVAKVTTRILLGFVVLMLASQSSEQHGVMARDVECTDPEKLLIDNLEAEIGKSQPCVKYKFSDNTEQPADFCPDAGCLAVFNQTAAEMPDCVLRDIWAKRFLQHLVERCEKANAGGNSTATPVPSSSNATTATPSTTPTATLKPNASSSSSFDGPVVAGDAKTSATATSSPPPAPSGGATLKTSALVVALPCALAALATTLFL